MKKNHKYFLWMTLAMIFWGANWTGAKIISTYAPIQVLVFYRFLLSALAVVPIILYKRLSFKLPPDIWPIVIFSSVLMGLYQWFYFEGVHLGLAGVGGVLVTTLNPLMTFAIEAVIKRKVLEKRELIGLGLGVISAVFFLQLWQFDLAQFWGSGTAYFFLAALTWSMLSIIGQHIKLSPIVYTFYVALLIAPVLLIGSDAHAVFSVFDFGATFWFWMIFLSTLGYGFATTLFFLANQKLGAKTASSFLFLVPTSALLVAFFVLNEPLSIPTIIGGIFALTGVAVLNFKAVPE